jgi:hypothetical protein
VTDERTRTVVLRAAKGIFNISVDSTQIDGPCTARVVKYIAKSAAKNINSLESQTIVPTATRLGRLILCGAAIVELVMGLSIPESTLTFLFRSEVLPLKFAPFG